MDRDRDRVRGGGGGGRRFRPSNRGRSTSHNPAVGNTQMWIPKSSPSVSQQCGQDRTYGNYAGVSVVAKSSPDSAGSCKEKLNCVSPCKDTCSSKESCPKHGPSEGKKDQVNDDGKYGKQILYPSSPECVSEKSEYYSAESSLRGTPELAKESPDLVTSSAEKMKSSCKEIYPSPESFNKQSNTNQIVEWTGNLSESLHKVSILCPLDVSGKSIDSPLHPTANRETEQSTFAPFDICLEKTGPPSLKASLLTQNRERRKEINRGLEGSKGSHLRSGMVLLKNFLSRDEQVSILKKCRVLGLGPGGFYQPGYSDEAQLRLKMMCLGKNWNPQTSMYESRRATDGAIPPIIPNEFNHLVKRAIEDAHVVIGKDPKASRAEIILPFKSPETIRLFMPPETILPFMSPDICIVNFYSQSGKLGLHRDRDESPESLRKGLPVVSFSIGYSAVFLYSDMNDVDKAAEVVLESGDALIFGGKSRHIFHGVTNIITSNAPRTLLEETNLRPGRLNLTFRQY